MLCSFLVYKKVNQTCVCIHPLFFGFPSHLGHHRALSSLCCTGSSHLLFSVTQSCQTLCDSTDCSRFPLPSPSPGVHSNSCPLSRWCHPTISSSVIPFSFYLQSFPASGSFPVSWLFASGGLRTGTSASAWVFPMNIQGWVPWGLTGLISLLSKGISKSLLQHHSSKAPILQRLTFMVQLSYLYVATGNYLF